MVTRFVSHRELFEFFLAPKHLKPNLIDANQLAELLVKKDFELKDALANAQEQEIIQSKIDTLKTEVEKHDEALAQLQKNFKEAEHILVSKVWVFHSNHFVCISQGNRHLSS